MRDWYRKIRAVLLQRMIPRSRVPFDFTATIDVTGLLSMTAGIGESARLCADALVRSGHTVTLSDVSFTLAEQASVDWVPPPVSIDPPKARILHLNPPMLPRGIAKLGICRFSQTFNIGYWAWELEVIPDEWKNAFRYMNAIFVPSEFTRAALQPFARIPVLVVPHPVAKKHADPDIRQRFGIPDEAFLVSNIFSAGSSINRKNPEAVLRAFDVFSAARSDTFLLMKASGDPAKDERLRALVESTVKRSNVRIVTENLPGSAVNGLIERSDAYISLHRSEGFGLTVAEAILAETPVVSTDYSGTVDFCDPGATWRVSAKLIPVRDAHPEFANLPNAVWADADVQQAAAHLCAIYDDRQGARKKAIQARAYLDQYLQARSYDRALRDLAASQTGN